LIEISIGKRAKLSRPQKGIYIKHVLILAGSGGHTGYAYSLAEALYEKEAQMHFLVPEDEPLSGRRLSRFGEVDFLVKPRGPKTPILPFVVNLAKSFLDSIEKVSNRFNVVVSSGSNFCIPPAIISRMKRIPLVNIESSVRFVKPSKTALLLQPFSTITALQWEEQRSFLRGVVTGPLFPKPKFKPRNGGYILVTGGTYGHKLLFDAIAESNINNVVLQTGKVNPKPYMEKHPEWQVFTLTERFQELLAGADIVVTHFGSTILEALVYSKPIVIVPNPEWTLTAGADDARYMAKKINAILLSEINPRILIYAINEAKKRKPPKLPNGAENLATLIMNMLC
jgi:UDP-N-acetylglucosamine:LPS N-acetylglucosamine transferase